MSAPEADLWRRFLKDESWHWKIYRPAFGQSGLSFSEVDAQTPLPTTRHLIETLHRISRRSLVSYAAAMIFIERSPVWESIDSDPLYQSLMTHYGFRAASVRPLPGTFSAPDRAARIEEPLIRERCTRRRRAVGCR
ncbi:hypothetical protein AB0M41_45385 [Streptomyces sp. NPDC051896]|uniref:hypothetical protein n=1 Tax=Streptomyces sp. NPDC051896 TaxID=3155416 RepID=UPI0034136D02